MKRLFFRCGIVMLVLGLITSCKHRHDQKYSRLPKELSALCEQIDRHPDDVDALYRRASYYYRQGEPEPAKADILTAIKLKPAQATYYILLSDIYFSERETDLAEENLQKAIALSPDNNEARLKLAELYFHLNMLEDCYRTLDEAIARSPHNPRAHLIRAFCLKEQGDTTGYLRMLSLAIDQNPKEIKAYLELGYFYQQKNDPVGIAYYQNALKVDPENTEINYNLALFYQELGQLDKALEQYNILLQINPNNPGAFNGIGYIKLNYRDEFEDAIQYFTRAIAQDSNFVMAICNRGIAYTYLKEYDKARTDFKTCQKIDPDFEPAAKELRALDHLKK
ncbi:MAG: tetratricopeptide repeat protein [Bacteroidales bacterium]|nr:tetratricopeptide repeat protein [Bacteroidales bacterium]